MKKILFILPFTFFLYALYAQDTDPYLKAVAAISKENYARAVQELSAVMDKNTNDIRIIIKRAECYYELGEYRSSINDCLKAEKIKNNIGSYLLSKSYAELGMEDSALFYLSNHLKSPYKFPESTIKLDPAFVDLEFTSGWKQVWKNDWYDEYEVLIAELKYLIKQEEYMEALDLADENLDKYPHGHQIQGLRGKIFLTLGDYNTAVSAYSKAIQIKNDQAEYYIERSEAYSRTEKYDKAVLDLDWAIRLMPENFALYLKRNDLHIKRNDYSKALRDIDFYHTYFPNDSQVQYQYGMTYYYQGSYLKALEWFNKCIVTNPTKAEYFIGRGNTYLRTKTYKYALYDYSMALDLEPDNPTTYLNKGIVRLHLNDTKGACYDWEKARYYGSFEAEEFLNTHCR